MNPRRTFPQLRRSPVRQRGVVLLFSLIALVVMLIAAVALVRSFQGSLYSAGNIAFKRDLQNQSEAAVAIVLQDFKTGLLSTTDGRKADSPGDNYKARMLATNAEGVPDLLNDDAAYAAAATQVVPVDSSYGVSIRYVVDRLCNAAGDEATIAATNCRLADNTIPTGGSVTNLKGAERSAGGKKGAAPQSVVYRLSVRVTGPRNTQSFFQSTFTVPS